MVSLYKKKKGKRKILIKQLLRFSKDQKSSIPMHTDHSEEDYRSYAHWLHILKMHPMPCLH